MLRLVPGKLNVSTPGTTEVCHNLDGNCDSQSDEGLVNHTCVGNVTFSTQAQVNAWSQCHFIIHANLLLQNAGIVNLSTLVNLVQVLAFLFLSPSPSFFPTTAIFAAVLSKKHDLVVKAIQQSLTASISETARAGFPVAQPFSNHKKI